MGGQRHLIQRQTVELRIHAPDQAQAIQTEVSRIFRQRVVPLIEKCCDELSSPDRLHRISQLEIELGSIDPARLEDDMIDKLGMALRKALSKQIERLNSSEGGGETAQTAAQQELFTLFVREGILPWWADRSQTRLPEQALDYLAREAPERLRQLLPTLVKDGRTLQRLAGHFDDRRLAALVFLAAPALADYPLALAGALSSSASDPPLLAAPSSARLKRLIWQSILANTFLSHPQPSERLDFSRGVVMRLAHLQAIPYAALVQGLAQAVAAGRLAGQVGTVVLAMEAENRRASGTDQTHQRDDGNSIPPANVRVGETAWLHSDKPGPMPGCVEGLDEIRTGLDSPARAAQSIGREGLALSNEASASLAQGPWEVGQAGFSDADALYLGNAGLVILWPFLGTLFGRLGLLEENRFIDEAARQRGVALLHGLAFGEPEPPEYWLPLNKLLCGMDLEAVFELEPPLTEAETAECETLLEAVIEQAPILNHMSVHGFRGSFLLRDGILSVRDGAWLLRVERETYDLVLDRFPWGFEWVRLPWMEAPLQVEW